MWFGWEYGGGLFLTRRIEKLRDNLKNKAEMSNFSVLENVFPLERKCQKSKSNIILQKKLGR